MDSKSVSSNRVGVIGAGNFGSAVANLLAQNVDVLVYSRRKETKEEHAARKWPLAENVELTNNLEDISRECKVIFPIIPSSCFRSVIREIAPTLHKDHVLIHGTKGLDVKWPTQLKNTDEILLTRKEVATMSEIISQETVVEKLGCISGPNLAGELAEKQPAATVVASAHQEVIQLAQKLLKSDLFQVYSSKDLLGTELCGVLKNIIAIVAGTSLGLGYGENAKGFLISRGIVEMVYIGKAMGATVSPFIGLSGIGDLVATCSSPKSRNHTVGYRLAQGEKLEDVLDSMKEVAEGINTVKVVRSLMTHYKTRVPITEVTYRVLFEGLPVQKALQYLMKYPFKVDIDFL